MKRKITIIVAIILVIILSIFIRNKVVESRVKYKIEEVEKYTYVKYREGDKYGIIDRNGNIIVDAKYSNIDIPNPERDLFICYESEDKSVVLNSNKDIIFEKYNRIEPISLKNIASTLCYEKSTLKYEKDGLYGLIDFNGKEITKNEYSSIENLQSTEGKFLVCKNDKYGVINLNGVKLVEPKYDGVITDNYYTDDTKYEKAGFIVSNTTDDGYRYGYIDYKGKTILGVEYNNIIRITAKKDLYFIASRNGQYGLYKAGKELIKPEYQSISYTDNGAVIIEKNGEFGIANIKGDIKVTTKYTEIEENGIYLYAQNPTENDVYNSEGKKVDINFSTAVYETGNDKYRVITLVNNDKTYYGIENKDGFLLVDTKYSYIEHLFGEYFSAENEEGKYGVINANGKVEIDFKYDSIQKLKNKNVIQAGKGEGKEADFYSANLEKVASMEYVRVDNNTNYIKIYNNKQTVFLGKDGNKIEENSEIIQKELQRELPDNIGDYKKIRYSLDDVYYMK